MVIAEEYSSIELTSKQSQKSRQSRLDTTSTPIEVRTSTIPVMTEADLKPLQDNYLESNETANG